MTVEIISQCTDEVCEAVQRLVPEISQSALVPSAQQVRDFQNQPGVYLFVYRENPGSEILGMLTLATFVIPTGLRAWVEDVVVHTDARGKGAGEALVRAAIAQAEKLGARTVDLTSRPTREAANRLYRRCGFELRETNVYRAKA